MEKEPNKTDWSGMEQWLTELIQQAKANAKRWFVIWLVTFFALVGTNAAWIYVFQSYEYVKQYSDGINSINSGTPGDIVNEPNGTD